jgi:two-component system LytT family response regulator
MQLRALIIDDELRSREFLRNLLNEYCAQVHIAGSASSVEEAIKLIQQLKPNLVFLDIEMQSGTGFDVLQQVEQHHFHVIFTTAYDHYAIQAIKFSAADYLLKPIDMEELRLAVQKVEEKIVSNTSQQTMQLLLQNLRQSKSDDFSIALSTSEGVEFVPLHQIIRLEASGPYTSFFLKEGKKIIVSKNLKEYEQMLGEYYFFRVHNSHIINLKEVKKMIRTDGGYVVMNDDSTIAISPKKKDDLMQLLAKRTV